MYLVYVEFLTENQNVDDLGRIRMQMKGELLFSGYHDFSLHTHKAIINHLFHRNNVLYDLKKKKENMSRNVNVKIKCVFNKKYI